MTRHPVFGLVLVVPRDKFHSLLVVVPQLVRREQPVDPFLDEGSSNSINRPKARDVDILIPGTQKRPTLDPQKSRGSPNRSYDVV